MLQAHLASVLVTTLVHELYSNLDEILSNLASLESFQDRSSQTSPLASSPAHLSSRSLSSFLLETVAEATLRTRVYLDEPEARRGKVIKEEHARQGAPDLRVLQVPMPVVSTALACQCARSAPRPCLKRHIRLPCVAVACPRASTSSSSSTWPD